MRSPKILSLFLAVVCAVSCSVAVLAAEVDCDSTYCFSASDFAGEEKLTGVCITGLPEADFGTVMLGTRVVRPGDILSAGQLEKLSFHPLRTEKDQAVTVTYLPIYENRVAPAATMTISIRGKEDKAPVAQDTALETYKNLANTGKLPASDPEGEEITYTLIRNPKRGQVTINADGSYTYTPKKNKVGTDSFTYTATDPAGNVSRTATVTVEILKPRDKGQYADTLGYDCRFAAEWMKNSGIFVGETISGQSCFQPERLVTRGEFMAMLVESLGLQVDEDATTTGFTDHAPTWLKPYLAAALRSGLTQNWPYGETFGASEPITGAEAALLLQNALALPKGEQSAAADAPAWAQDALAVMSQYGLELDARASMTRGQVAMALYQAKCLMPSAPGMMVFGKQ